jgi:hypothetical protein
MKTRYQYIHFVQTTNPKVWICENNKSGEELGQVQWYQPWRQFCYFPSCPAVYSVGCLSDINDFIAQLTAEKQGAGR